MPAVRPFGRRAGGDLPLLDSDLIRQVFATAAGYPYATVNAINPWSLVGPAGQSQAATGAWLCDLPNLAQCATYGYDHLAIGPLPAAFVGTGLFLAVLAVVGWTIARRPDRLTILVGVAVLAVAFFVVPTRVHERYLFPFFPLAAILAAVSPGWRLPYAALSVANLANMYWVLTFRYDMPTADDWLGIGRFIAQQPVATAVALIHLGGFVWIVTQLRRPAIARLNDEVAGRRDRPRGQPGGGARRPARRPTGPTGAPGRGLRGRLGGAGRHDPRVDVAAFR